MTELLFPEHREPSGVAGTARGVLTRWLAEDGGHVLVGQRVVEIRRGADTVCVRALATGTLWHQAREGEVLDPGAPVALVE